MMNFDMIGRMDSTHTLNIGGVGTSSAFGDVIWASKPHEFKLKIDSSGIGPSDHTSFYSQGVPVLFLDADISPVICKSKPSDGIGIFLCKSGIVHGVISPQKFLST